MKLEDLDNEIAFEAESASEWQPPQVGFAPLPKGGGYVFRLAKVGVSDFSETYLPQVSLEVVESKNPAVVGRTLNFVTLWPTPQYRPPAGVQMDWDTRKAQIPNTSDVLDMLKALGYDGDLRTLPRNAGELHRLIESYVGSEAKAYVAWSAYCSTCKEKVPAKDLKTSYSVVHACGETVTAKERVRWEI